MDDSFVAYPSQPTELRAAVGGALSILETDFGINRFTSWEENDIAGRFLVDPILESIQAGQSLLADITKLNFNVTFEIGYAIGLKRRVLLVRNGAIKGDDDLIREVGLFDTLGYKTYVNSRSLADFLKDLNDMRPLTFDERKINTK